MELQNAGVKVSVVNCGDFKTNFTGCRENLPIRIANEHLKKEFQAAVTSMEKEESIAGDASKVTD
jgi:short-subunit dehydrogenase